MATAETISVLTSEEATARIALLGMEQEYEAMLDYARRTAPGLLAIETTLEYSPGETRTPAVVIWVHRSDPGPGDDPTNRAWAAWFPRAFPPEVCEHFVMLSCIEANHAG